MTMRGALGPRATIAALVLLLSAAGFAQERPSPTDAPTSSTLELAQDAVAASRRANGPESLELSDALHNLGDAHAQRGEFLKALPHLQAALTTRRRLAPGQPAEADTLERLAWVEARIERYQSARAHAAQAFAVRDTRRREDPLAVAGSLELSGWVERYAGDYADARRALERGRSIRAAASASSTEPVTSLELAGDLLMLEGDVAGARRVWLDASRAVAASLGDDHPLIAALDRRLALAAAAEGDRQQSLDYLAHGLQFADRRLAPCDPERIGLKDYEASSLMYDGRFIEARAQFEMVLERSRACVGERHSITATVTANLASLTALMGDLAEAERLNRRAIAVWAAVRPDHPFVAQGLDALADVVSTRGQLAEARTLYERALRIRRQVNPSHPNVAWTLTNLARVSADSGRPALALQYVRQAMDIYEASGVGDDPDHRARALMLYGTLLGRQGDYVSARTRFTEALQSREQFFGSTHPLTADARAAVARADWLDGETDRALSGALAAEDAGREHLRSTARYLSERQALAYAATKSDGLGVALSIAAGRDEAVPTAVFDAVIRSRSLVLDELADRRVTLSVPNVAAAAAQLTAQRQRLANLMLRSLQGWSDPTAARMLLNATRAREDAERALAFESAEFRAELNRTALGLDEVRQALPSNTALVSFVRYARIVRGPRPAVVPSYLAFVLAPGASQPAVVAIGTASSVDGAVRQWREAMEADIGLRASDAGAPSFFARGIRLRHLIWDPLIPHLRGVPSVLVVPDGDLNLVPFAALPVNGREYLLERGPRIHYVAAERDLPNLLTADGPRGQGMLALGGATFGASLSAQSPVSSGCGSLQPLQFADLPASTGEAQAIARLWRQAGRDVPAAAVLSGTRATEGSVKTLAPGRRIIHLATHAFVLNGECGRAGLGLRGAGRLVPVTTAAAARPPASGVADNPLLLSGLALAGANVHAVHRTRRDDGILTAEEVAALDLRGVEWAVLSACDTGLGEIRASEGVIGLRRAFQVAGTRTVVMSLWSVEDQATRAWMEALYKARLVEGLSTADSTQQASLRVLHQRRARGQSTHPFYWAGFVASGDWR